MSVLKQFIRTESGVSSLEYAIIAAVLAMALISILTAMSLKIANKMSKVNNAMTHSSYVN